MKCKTRYFVICLAFLSAALNGNADLRIEEFKRSVMNVHPVVYDGWCSKEKAAIFMDLILDIKPNVCVEIGIYGGATFFPIVSTLKFLGHGIAYAVDPWDTFECIRYLDPILDETNRNWWVNVGVERLYDVFLGVLSKYQLGKHAIVLRRTSAQAASLIDSIDFLHLDGNHTEVATTNDVELYLPKVRSGGYICINDTLWPAMQTGVELLMEACDVVQLIDNGNAILFRKR